MKKIITVSRQFGSGGRSIAKMIAEALGYDYYDIELTNKVAEETGFDPAYIADAGEYAPGKSILSYALGNSAPHGIGQHINASDYLWATQSRIITELAEKGNCVIVGRCADYILRDRNDCLNVFIHADDTYRAKRIVELYGVRDKSPQKRLEEKDGRRRANYKYFTGREWGKTENYHIALDSSILGSELCVKLVTEIVKNK